MNSLRDLRDRLAELSRARRASSRVVRHSLVWRTRMAGVVRESENAGHLDLLGGSCLLLTRTALAMSLPERRRLAPGVRELAAAIADLARAPGDRPTQQRAADRALDLARSASSPGYQPAFAAAAALQMVASDVMVFAGVDPGPGRPGPARGHRRIAGPRPAASVAKPTPLGPPTSYWMTRGSQRADDPGGVADGDVCGQVPGRHVQQQEAEA